MKSNWKSQISIWLRKVRLIRFFDRIRYYLVKIRKWPANHAFRTEHPDIPLPPDYLMYESFQLDYYHYLINGRKTAEWLLGLVGPHTGVPPGSILDWGCGPGRIIRHLPDLIPGATYYGTDYNPLSIQWCRQYLPGISFSLNRLLPPMDFKDHTFDLVYGISVFTHLSEMAHQVWIEELNRVLKPGGILFLTLHGDSFTEKMNTAELQQFNQAKLVVRGQVKEGHRTFTAFHPEKWVREWTRKFILLEHLPGKTLEQDVWIWRKRPAPEK